MKKLDEMTPQEWLLFNYNLKIGNRVVVNMKKGIITNVVETDNIG